MKIRWFILIAFILTGLTFFLKIWPIISGILLFGFMIYLTISSKNKLEKTYKILTLKSENVKIDTSMCKLKKNHYYKIQPERIYGLVPNNKSIDTLDSFTLDLLKIRFYGRKKVCWWI